MKTQLNIQLTEAAVDKKNRLYLWIVALIAAFYIGFLTYESQTIDWSPSFSGSDKIPYGTYILQNELETLFPDSDIQLLTTPPFEYLLRTDREKGRTNWVFINDRLDPDSNEMDLLLKRVEGGDHLFISTSAPGDVLAEELSFKVRYTSLFDHQQLNLDRLTEIDQTESELIRMNLMNPALMSESGWEFEGGRIAYFSELDTARTTLLGGLTEERNNFVRIEHGSGLVYVHLLPVAFTNYYTREEHHAEYAFKILSCLPVRDVIWDEYYKTGRDQYSTPMGYVLSEPRLRNGWFLALAGILLFMIFKGRRNQRAIPERHKPENSTLQFAKTIGSLYLEKGSHKGIAEKKIRYFMDYCRRNVGVDPVYSDSSISVAEAIAGPSGVPQKQIEKLLEQVKQVQRQNEISKEELKQVTSQIDQFYKDSER